MSISPLSSRDQGTKNSKSINELTDTSDNNEIQEYEGFDAAATDDIRELAKTMSHLSREQTRKSHGSQNLVRLFTQMSQVEGMLPYTNELNEELNPDSDNFDARLWVKNLKKLRDSDRDYYLPSSLGVAYRNLSARGVSADSDYGPTVFNALYKYANEGLRYVQKDDPSRYFNILKSMDAIMRPGEVTVVLGRPGSGCTTLLKTIASQTYGFKVDKESRISYDGLTPKDIENQFRGDVVYSAETDTHFPHLTVGDTLEFAAKMRTPQNRGNVGRETYAKHMTSVYMATYGLSHTRNTKVGNDFVRGVSGGERKRVSIAEVSLSGSNIQCWDNATRGLDSATALEFIRALKTSATILDATPLIAIYQCSQDAYDLFDNVVVLYEGHQIFYGKTNEAKEYFINMGWECPQRQTTADFLTSLTNPAERVPRPGFETSVPYTPKEFETFWKNSSQYKKLVEDIEDYFQKTDSGNHGEEYHQAHVARQSNHISPKSPFTVSFFMQTRYIMSRNILRTKGDPSIPLQSIAFQAIMGLIIGSAFFNLEANTESFFYRSAVLFFATLFNSFSSILEIMSLFEARPIVEKHKQYALYRPSADALAGIITELPVKFLMSMCFNFFLYFMTNLRRDAGRFFFYWLMNALCTLVMSHLFRSLGAVSTSFSGAMTPATVLLMAMVIFAGFCIPPPVMLGWSRWIGYINPVAYVFEALMINEFNDREFTCSGFVPAGPSYQDISPDQRICSVTGSHPGLSLVNGSDHIAVTYEYYNIHKWKAFGIILGFIIFFLFLYVTLTEFNKGSMQKGEVTLFLKSSLKDHKKKAVKLATNANDIENSAVSHEKISYNDQLDANKEENNNDNTLPSSKDIFHWRDLTYQVKIKSEDRVILNHVDGWVKPGQLTALMGSSGAGKTTLLNCLSERVTSGVISDGVRMINGHELGSSFQRSIGYVQQQDLHLPTSTVREALRFSAQLRQPHSVTTKEKNDYVEYIIDLLEMCPYADALVGVAGEGLNVEQRKRLTIGVELVAKPQLLLFLDEPTSGLDSQTAWSICKLMRKLADHGQAILCTIHQPSAILLQEFDRLLFLQKGGKTVYFGDLGKNCLTLINYFEKYGAHHCPEEANPAEWMLEVVGAAPGSHANQDYHEVWKNSTEFQTVKNELAKMEAELVKIPKDESPDANRAFAAPIWKQYLIVTKRVFEQNWRAPSYIYSKIVLVVSSSLFNGFAFFKADRSLQGLQNQMISIIQFLIPFMTLVQQMLPYYIKQRDVYEVREAPSKTFSWFAFITAQITSEIPYQVAIGTLGFFCWYYPVGLYENAVPTDSVDSRGVLMWLFITAYYVYTSTMGHLCVSFIEVPDNAANLAVNLFTVCLIFCGVLAPYDFLPGFWTFLFRCSPLTYFVQGMASTGLSNTAATCSEAELLKFAPTSGQTCGEYMAAYMKEAGGYLIDKNATSQCEYCTISSTNDYLAGVKSLFSERWRNWGIVICFIAFNIIFTVFFYWLARVPKSNREKRK